MELGLRGKAAVMSGSTAGIGLAIATALAAEGAKIVVNVIRRPTHRQFRTAAHNSWSDATVAAA
jgi:NAD(P)-dependent dehydrogenase (short-subunit alcohol dehydrogenase family)